MAICPDGLAFAKTGRADDRDRGGPDAATGIVAGLPSRPAPPEVAWPKMVAQMRFISEPGRFVNHATSRWLWTSNRHVRYPSGELAEDLFRGAHPRAQDAVQRLLLGGVLAGEGYAAKHRR